MTGDGKRTPTKNVGDARAAKRALFAGARAKKQVHYTQWCRRKGTKSWTHMGTPDSGRAEVRFKEWATDPAYEYRLDRETSVEVSVVVSP